MKSGAPFFVLLFALFFSRGFAEPDFAGDWQGTLNIGEQKLRLVFRIEHAASGWYAFDYSPDQAPEPLASTAVTVEGATIQIHFSVPGGAVYRGTLNSNGSEIAGQWTWQNNSPDVLNFSRAPKENPWLSARTYTEQFFTVKPGVDLEVVDWGGAGRSTTIMIAPWVRPHIVTALAATRVGIYTE